MCRDHGGQLRLLCLCRGGCCHCALVDSLSLDVAIPDVTRLFMGLVRSPSQLAAPAVLQGELLAFVSNTASRLLVTGRTAEGTFALATSRALLPPIHQSTQAITPGQVKFGIDSAPQGYVPAAFVGESQPMGFSLPPSSQAAPVSPFLSMAPTPAAGMLPKGETSPALASTTSSASTYATPPGEDDNAGSSLQEPSGSYKKTRRGKRAGKNLRLRNAESQLRRSISDLRHGNDPQRIPSFASQIVRPPLELVSCACASACCHAA